MLDVSAGTYPSGVDRAFTYWLQFTGNGLGANATWVAKDPVNGYSPLTGGAAQSAAGSTAIYDTNTDTVIVAMNSTGALYRYTPSTNTYAVLSFSANTTYGNSAQFADLDTLHNNLWFMGGSSYTTGSTFYAGYIDMSGAGGYALVNESSTLAATCSGMFGTGSPPTTDTPGFQFDPIISKFVGYNETNTVYIFDPVALSCSTETLTGYTIPSFPVIYPASGIFGRFRQTPEVPGQYVYVSSDGTTDTVKMQNVDAPVGLGHSTLTCLDVDGDGYGVGPGCLGPDADDNDASVQTGAQGITKWTTLKLFVSHLLGFTPANFWYIAPSGGSDSNTCHDTTGSTNIGTPCATFAHVASGMAAGDVVLVRGGTYTQELVPANGASVSDPSVWMAYPGELPIINNNPYPGIDFAGNSAYITVRGIKVINGLGNNGCIGNGGFNANYINLMYNEVSNCYSGFMFFQGLTNFNLQYNVAHDITCSSCQHGIYLGSHTIASANVRVSDNIVYNTWYPGIQWNGRVTNLFMEQNLIYNSIGSSGVSWLEGVSNSFFRNNVIFNTGGAPFKMYDYDGDCYTGTGSNDSSGICPYAQTGNLIENNTFYIGTVGPDGSTTNNAPALVVGNTPSLGTTNTGCPPAYVAGNTYDIGATVLYPWQATGGTVYTSTVYPNTGNQPNTSPSRWTAGAGCTMSKQGNIGGNTFRNNIFVNNGGYYSPNYPPVLFPMCTEASLIAGGSNCALDGSDTTLSTSTFTNNIFWNTNTGSCAGGGCGNNVIATGPTPSSYPYGFTGHTCSGSASLTGISGCTNSDPGFASADPSAYYASPASFNFTLQSASPAIGAGTAVGAPVTDILGSARANPLAIGAYEPNGGGGSSGGGDPSGSQCDLNGDGTVNVIDVQIAINQALGITSCGSADLTGSGQCTVVDVQRVIDASLGGACIVGP